VVLLQSDVNWLTEPPEVRLNVRTKEVLTPTRAALEEFIEKKKVHPDFEVGQLKKSGEKTDSARLEPTPYLFKD